MTLAYSDDGPGPVVVLIHAFPLDRSVWAGQVADLGARYRLICPDLRGFGASLPGPEPVYGVDRMADDVIELLDALGIREPVIVGGLSMGGYVALSMALRYRDRLRGLLIVNSRAGADTEATARVREDLARQVEATASTEAVAAAMLPKFFSPVTAERRADLIERVRRVMAACPDPARGIAAALRGLATRPDRTADLAAIDLPTLVLAGADDALIPPSEGQTMADAIPRARLVIVPEAGHLAPLENPAAVNVAIAKFLDDLA